MARLTKKEQEYLNAILNTYEVYDDPETYDEELALLKSLIIKLTK